MLRKIHVLILSAGLTAAIVAGPAAGAKDRAGALGTTMHSAARAHIATYPAGQKLDCVYSDESESILGQFAHAMHRQVNCAEIFNMESPTWSEWAHPWYLNHIRDAAWSQWATAPGHSRQLVISQTLIPTNFANHNWRAQGAAGRYVKYARELSTNLVAAGLGHSILRLAPEMNGTWNIDNVGNTNRDMSHWAAFWRRTVQAMRSVPGAHFQFDWTINAAVRPIPLSDFYPGNGSVDIVGIDAYDQGVAAGEPRWDTIYNRPDGISDVLNFANAHGKPLSIPEWGLSAPGLGSGGGDDPAYINGIGSLVRDNNVAYQSYFFTDQFATQLLLDSRSLRAYRSYFG